MTPLTEAEQKSIAAAAALQLVQSNSLVGLGSGSTAEKFIVLLGKAVADGKLTGIKVLSSSLKSATLAADSGLEVLAPESVKTIDINIDGTDETNINTGDSVKGGGNALHREKMIALKSKRNIFIAEEKKAVQQLGAFGLPIEVSQFDAQSTLSRIQAILPETATVQFKEDYDEKVITDNQHYMAHIDFGDSKLDNPRNLYKQLMLQEGVFSLGLFLNIADQLIIGKADGNTETFSF